LTDLDLPDQEMYDQIFSLQRSLIEHRRTDALSTYRKMYARVVANRLVLTARRLIAA